MEKKKNFSLVHNCFETIKTLFSFSTAKTEKKNGGKNWENNIGCLVDWCQEQDMLFSLNPKQPKNDWVVVNLSNDNTGMVQLDFRRFVNLEVPYEYL